MFGHRILALAASLLLLPPVASALPILRVALFDVAPYVIGRVAAEPSGPYVKLVRELAHGAGYEVEIVLLPFARIAGSLGDGSADLTIGFATQALDATALKLGDVLIVDSLVVTSTNRPARRIDELSGHVIGRARGGCQDLASLPQPAPQLVEVNGFSSGVRMLALGRLDGLCLTREVLDYYAREAGINRAQLGPEIVISRRAVALFARRDLDAGIVQRLRAVLAKHVPRVPQLEP